MEPSPIDIVNERFSTPLSLLSPSSNLSTEDSRLHKLLGFDPGNLHSLLVDIIQRLDRHGKQLVALDGNQRDLQSFVSMSCVEGADDAKLGSDDSGAGRNARESQNDVQDSDKLVSETLRIDNNVLHERLIQIESTVSRLVESLSLQHPLSVDPSRSSADRDVFPPNSSLKTGSSPKHTDDCSLFVANESSFSYEEKYTLLSDRIESLQQKLDSLFSNAANCTRSSYEDKEEGVRIETTPSPGSQSLEFILSRLSNLEDNLSLLKKESISSHAYMPLSIPAIPRIQLKIPSTNVTREISPSSPISEYPNEVLLVQLYTSPPPEDNLSENFTIDPLIQVLLAQVPSPGIQLLQYDEHFVDFSTSSHEICSFFPCVVCDELHRVLVQVSVGLNQSCKFEGCSFPILLLNLRQGEHRIFASRLLSWLQDLASKVLSSGNDKLLSALVEQANSLGKRLETAYKILKIPRDRDCTFSTPDLDTWMQTLAERRFGSSLPSVYLLRGEQAEIFNIVEVSLQVLSNASSDHFDPSDRSHRSHEKLVDFSEELENMMMLIQRLDVRVTSLSENVQEKLGSLSCSENPDVVEETQTQSLSPHGDQIFLCTTKLNDLVERLDLLSLRVDALELHPVGEINQSKSPFESTPGSLSRDVISLNILSRKNDSNAEALKFGSTNREDADDRDILTASTNLSDLKEEISLEEGKDMAQRHSSVFDANISTIFREFESRLFHVEEIVHAGLNGLSDESQSFLSEKRVAKRLSQVAVEEAVPIETVGSLDTFHVQLAQLQKTVTSLLSEVDSLHRSKASFSDLDQATAELASKAGRDFVDSSIDDVFRELRSQISNLAERTVDAISDLSRQLQEILDQKVDRSEMKLYRSKYDEPLPDLHASLPSVQPIGNGDGLIGMKGLRCLACNQTLPNMRNRASSPVREGMNLHKPTENARLRVLASRQRNAVSGLVSETTTASSTTLRNLLARGANSPQQAQKSSDAPSSEPGISFPRIDRLYTGSNG